MLWFESNGSKKRSGQKPDWNLWKIWFSCTKVVSCAKIIFRGQRTIYNMYSDPTVSVTITNNLSSVISHLILVVFSQVINEGMKATKSGSNIKKLTSLKCSVWFLSIVCVYISLCLTLCLCQFVRFCSLILHTCNCLACFPSVIPVFAPFSHCNSSFFGGVTFGCYCSLWSVSAFYCKSSLFVSVLVLFYVLLLGLIVKIWQLFAYFSIYHKKNITH